MQETRTYLRDTLYRDGRAKFTKYLRHEHKHFQKKKKKTKEKWAIQTPKFKQETALNKKTNLTLSGELTFVNSDCNTSSQSPLAPAILQDPTKEHIILKICMNSLE